MAIIWDDNAVLLSPILLTGILAVEVSEDQRHNLAADWSAVVPDIMPHGGQH